MRDWRAWLMFTAAILLLVGLGFMIDDPVRIAYSLLSLALAAVLTWLAIRSVEDGRPGSCVSHLVSDSDCLLGQSQQLGRPCHTSASAPNGHPKKAAASLDETAAEVHKRNLPTRKREDRASEA